MKPFETIEEVDHYLSHERITCLLCGRKFKALAAHLWRSHDGMTVDDYRDQLNIPPNKPLICQGTIRQMSESNHTDHGILRERAKKAREKQVRERGRVGGHMTHPLHKRQLAHTARTAARKSKLKMSPRKAADAHKVYMAHGVGEAARRAGVSRATLYNWFGRLGLPLAHVDP